MRDKPKTLTKCVSGPPNALVNHKAAEKIHLVRPYKTKQNAKMERRFSDNAIYTFAISTDTHCKRHSKKQELKKTKQRYKISTRGG